MAGAAGARNPGRRPSAHDRGELEDPGVSDMPERPREIFVVGLEPHQRRVLERLPRAGELRFHALLPAERLRGVQHLPMDILYREAQETLEAWHGPVDGIITLLDFPAPEIAALLIRERGLPGPGLEAVMRCNHKYWSRLLQQDAVPEAVPAFAPFDPFDEDAAAALEGHPGYPLWVKPLNAYRSLLGFRVEDRAGLERALNALRDGIARLADPFSWFLPRTELPREIATLPAHTCIAESILAGHQCTLEGYVQDGTPHAYAVIDSIRDPNGVSFARYQYPSTLPASVQARMAELAERAVQATGLQHSPFNVEFFYDAERDRIGLLEINPRLSQSHCEILEMVNGASHQQIAVDLALGRAPQVPEREGPWPCAAKLFIRAFRDGCVRRVPDGERIREIEQRLPGVSIQLQVAAGERLSKLADQDSYSFELACVWIGAEDTRQLLARFEQCRDWLGIEIDSDGQERVR